MAKKKETKAKDAAASENKSKKKATDAAVGKKAAPKGDAVAAEPHKSKRLLEVEENKLTLIEGWVRDGVIERDIAKRLGCSYSTLREWKKISPALSTALKKNREYADYAVESALFKKACGHKESVVKPMKIKKTEYDPETGKRIADYEEIVYVKEEVYIPPDTLADIFWLKNREPEKWRDKVEQQQDISLDENSGVIFLAPVLEKNREPEPESNMATTAEAN